MKCNNCGYVWTYKGTLHLATCPSCGLKQKTKGEDSQEEVNDD